MTTHSDTLCPSSPLREGAILLGIVQEDGRIAYLSQEVVVDDEFIEVARQGRAPERRFRFAGSCVESGCTQWTGSRCGVIERVLDLSDSIEVSASGLPRCSIRSSCRWFGQEGKDACRVCPIVVTNTTLAT